MSELFNALQKLEEENASKTPHLPPLTPEAAGGGKKRSIPYFKSILLFALIMIVTVTGFFVVSSGQVQMFFKEIGQGTVNQQKTVMPPPDALEQSDILKPPDNVLPVVADMEINISPLSVQETKEYQKAEVRNQSFPLAEMGFPEPEAVVRETVVLPGDDKVELGYAEDNRVTEHDISQQLEALENALLEQQRRQTRQEFLGKRLLHRAWQLRSKGEPAQALRLYKQAWHKSPNPAIANNIAAILIGMHSYREAEDYLHKALELAPDDPDIIFNLQIAVQGRKSGKR